MYMEKPFEDFGDEFKVKIPKPKLPPKPTLYGPVIRALKELVKALEVIDNSQIAKQRSNSAKKRWALVPPEKKKANTAAARAAVRKTKT